MHIDDLPLREHVGYLKTLPNGKHQYLLYTHLEFIFTYNNDQIISVTFSNKVNPIDLDQENLSEIDFTYSVKWTKTTKEFKNRLERYVDTHLYPEEVEIQWFSIINSLVLVVLLTCFLAFILMRILKRDVQLYTDPEDKEEIGWKFIHTDVFRFPNHVNFLSSLLGNGTQLIALSGLILFLSLLGVYYPDYSYRTMYLSIIIVYVITTGINGFVSGMFYKQLGGENWINNVLLSTFLFVGPIFSCWSILNTIALYYGSTSAFPFKSIVIILALYFLISFPLQLIGSITAKKFCWSFSSTLSYKTSTKRNSTYCLV